MNGLSLIVWLTMAQLTTGQPSAVQVVTLPGEQYEGTLDAFTPESVTVKSDVKSQTIPIEEVLQIRTAATLPAAAADAAIEIRLVDDSRLRAKSMTTAGSTATITHSQLGEIKIPTAAISSVRLAPSDPKIDAEWTKLVERTIKKDVVAVRKGDVLDHLDGVVGALEETTMQFQMDGDDIPIKREKVFGLIYSKRESTAKKAIAQLDLSTGDRLALRTVAWSGNLWKVRLVSGAEFEVGSDLFRGLDYSLGKVTYLSDLEPRAMKYTPEFGFPGAYPVYEFRRDKNFEGGPITLGNKPYAKGLAIHSQTMLKYRLGGDYRRFQAVMGIGDEIRYGDVDVTLKGDGKTLFKSAVKASTLGDKGTVQRSVPQILDVDVAGVVELEVFVDYGSDGHDNGDRLYLGNARVVK